MKNEHDFTSVAGGAKLPFVEPEIRTVPSAQIIESLGPAVAVYGSSTGGGIIP